jgi:hypothetical protein
MTLLFHFFSGLDNKMPLEFEMELKTKERRSKESFVSVCT